MTITINGSGVISGLTDVNSYLPSNSIDGSAVGVNNVTTNAGSNMFAIVTADAEL